MCLDTVSERKPKSTGIGYKAFKYSPDGGLVGEFASKENVRPVGEWLKAKDYSPNDEERGMMGHIRGEYKPGWHIYKTLDGIRDWMGGLFGEFFIIKKVKYRKAHTQGVASSNRRGIVADEIFITREVI